LSSDQRLATELMEKIVEKSGNSIRIGITGSPGVGKSTFIESFGLFLTGIGKKVAVLTIDPTSQRTKGSILGDKTRMPDLAVHANAFIRPSSSGNTLGGVAHKTREAMLLCEAAGFDVILIETVGVGQSEVAVKNMTDFFLLLMLPGSGDELQGIKKGIMEMADLILITKADGENLSRARQAQAEFLQAIHTLYMHITGWVPSVLTASSITREGLPEVYHTISKFISEKKAADEFDAIRVDQSVTYMHENFFQLLRDDIANSDFLRGKFHEVQLSVQELKLSPGEAGKKLLHVFYDFVRSTKS
jgi:LAO/AO transport system kinase